MRSVPLCLFNRGTSTFSVRRRGPFCESRAHRDSLPTAFTARNLAFEAQINYQTMLPMS
jgi:hypothetical protein